MYVPKSVFPNISSKQEPKKHFFISRDTLENVYRPAEKKDLETHRYHSRTANWRTNVPRYFECISNFTLCVNICKYLLFTFVWPCIVTNFITIKPTRCTNFTNLFCHETLHVLQWGAIAILPPTPLPKRIAATTLDITMNYIYYIIYLQSYIKIHEFEHLICYEKY